MARPRKLTTPVSAVSTAKNEPASLPRYVWVRALQDAITDGVEKLCETTVPPNVIVNIGAGLKTVKRLRVDANTVITTNEVQVYHEDQTRDGNDKKGNFELFIAPTVNDPERIAQLMLQGILHVVASKDTMESKDKTPWKLAFIDTENEKAFDGDMRRWTKIFGLKRVEHAEGKHVTYEPTKRTKEFIDAAIQRAGGYEHARLVLKDPAVKKAKGEGEGGDGKKGDVNRQVLICCPHHLQKVHMTASDGQPMFKTVKDDRGHPQQKPIEGPACDVAFRASRTKYEKVFGPQGVCPIVCKIHGEQVVIDDGDIQAIAANNKNGTQYPNRARTTTADNARVRTRKRKGEDAPAAPVSKEAESGEGEQPPFPGSDATGGQEQQTVPLAAAPPQAS